MVVNPADAPTAGVSVHTSTPVAEGTLQFGFLQCAVCGLLFAVFADRELARPEILSVIRALEKIRRPEFVYFQTVVVKRM